MDFTIKKCDTKAAYSSNPKAKIKLDLNKIKKKYELVLDTPILVVIKISNEEIIIHDYGEILFKTLEDEDKIKKIANDIYKFKRN